MRYISDKLDQTPLVIRNRDLAIDVDQGIKGEQVVEAMARILSLRIVP